MVGRIARAERRSGAGPRSDRRTRAGCARPPSRSRRPPSTRRASSRRAPRRRRRTRPRGAGSARRTPAPSTTTRRRPGSRPGTAAAASGEAGRSRDGVRQRQERLGRVADHVQPRRRHDPAAATTPASGSTIACDGRRYRCEIPVLTRCSGMSSTATVVASRAGPARGRDRQVRPQRTRHRRPATHRRVDVVHDRRRVRDDQVRDLRGVDRRAAADRHEPVDLRFQREVGRGLPATPASARPASRRTPRPRSPTRAPTRARARRAGSRDRTPAARA